MFDIIFKVSDIHVLGSKGPAMFCLQKSMLPRVFYHVCMLIAKQCICTCAVNM